MSQEYYGIKVDTLINAAERLTSDLDYLCALVEEADPEFPIRDAISYAYAIVSLSTQLEFVLEDLANNDLSEDEIYVKLTTEDVHTLNRFTENSEDSLKRLEETCGISLQNN
tara:strand:+ start:603 stop:938 length:336 start_codon:yes stop_codon:yes gene_type:complete